MNIMALPVMEFQVHSQMLGNILKIKVSRYFEAENISPVGICVAKEALLLETTYP
jgi:hypothetical protein